MGAPEMAKQMFISKSSSELVGNRRQQNFRQWLLLDTLDLLLLGQYLNVAQVAYLGRRAGNRLRE